MTYERAKRFYAFGVLNGRKEHYRFYDGRNKRNMNAAMMLDFLRYLHAKYPRLLLIWDEASHHSHSGKVRAYARTNDIKLLEFPTACPEENPVEQAWDYFKETTANTYYPGYPEFIRAVRHEARVKNLTKMFQYLNH